MKRLSFFVIFILLMTGLTMETLYAQEPYSPRGYTTMDDLFIPEAPFPHSIAYEEYRFRPIRFKENGRLELEIFIYVEPAYHTGLSTPKQQAEVWLQQVRQKAEGDVTVREQGPVKLARVEAYKLVYEAQGFEPGIHDDAREPSDRFIERVFFIPVATKQMAFIRLVRKVENDNDLQTAVFRQDWQTFLDSLSIGPGAPHLDTTQGRAPNTRRYHVRNLRFEIPIGLPNTLNKWSIKNNAKRTDTWKTPQGEIRFQIAIYDGYEFTMKEENKRLIAQTKARVEDSPILLKRLVPDENVAFDYIKTLLGKHSFIYGYSDDNGCTKNFTFKTAYKDGKILSLEVSGDTKTIEAHQKVIMAWLAHFIIMP